MSSHHTSDETRIRALIENWTRAISSGDNRQPGFAGSNVPLHVDVRRRGVGLRMTIRWQ
jgi:hypothetical protein